MIMEQRVYQGSISVDGLAQALLDEWDRGDTIAQAFGEEGHVVVQIGQRGAGWFTDEPTNAITLGIEPWDGGVRVTMGQQQWYKDGGVQFIGGGLIGFFPFFFAFPLGQIFGSGQEEIDASLPGQIWRSIERYVEPQGGTTGKTQRLPTVNCPNCGVANPQGAERCSACGSHLSAVPSCPNCGHVNPPGASFCNRCGTQVGPIASAR
jgi:ribosomal protein L40E